MIEILEEEDEEDGKSPLKKHFKKTSTFNEIENFQKLIELKIM
jgi:hypothetical protein